MHKQYRQGENNEKEAGWYPEERSDSAKCLQVQTKNTKNRKKKYRRGTGRTTMPRNQFPMDAMKAEQPVTCCGKRLRALHLCPLIFREMATPGVRNLTIKKSNLPRLFDKKNSRTRL